MSSSRTTTMAAAALAVWLGMAGSVQGQHLDEPDRARVKAGPLALSPFIRLTNFGFDSNVFSESEAQDPQSDITGTLSPAVDMWLRLPGARVRGRTELDLVYFKELSQLRSLDSDSSVRADLLLNRLRPYVAGQLSNTRHRLNLEIDAPVRVRDEALVVGTAVRVTGKSSIDVRVRRARVEYEDDAVYLDSHLSRLLDRTTTGGGIAFRYSATPLTDFGVDVQQQRDRFVFTTDRDSDRVRVAPFVEFQPHALISGRAEFGVHRRAFIGRDIPDAQGTFMLVDLQYTLMGRTRFGIEAERDVAYSYRVQEEEYQFTGFTASVAQYLSDSWDVRARVGRHRLTYLVSDFGGEALNGGAAPGETVVSYGADLGYRTGGARLGIQVDYRHRRSGLSLRREYDRLRIASSVSYDFN